MSDKSVAADSTQALKLKATDFASLDVVSTLTHDSIFYTTSIDYSDQNFKILINRFRWEDAIQAISVQHPEHFTREHAILSFYNITKVDMFNIKSTVKPLVLMAIHASENEINLSLAFQQHITLYCKEILVYCESAPKQWYTHNIHVAG